MIQVLVPIFAVAVSFGVGVVALAGPAPVVVVGEVTAGGWVTLVVTPPEGCEVRAGHVRVSGPGGPAGFDVGAGTHRVPAGHGSQRLTWSVSVTGGGTTTGSVRLDG